MHWLLALFISTAICGSAAARPRHVVHDLTPDFWRFLDAVAVQPGAAQRDWRRYYSDPHRTVLSDVECPALASGNLPANQLAGWQRLAPRMRLVSREARRSLPTALERFAKAFPDLKWQGDVYIMVSASCFDGRAQEIKGRRAMLIGVDVLAATGNQNPTPLVLHEVFHLYHRQFFAPSSDPIWASLWSEGLATYVSRSLEPDATLGELLLPADMVAAVNGNRQRLASNLLSHFSDRGGRAQTLYFRTDDRTEPVPPRAGYYLGLLVAERLAARGHDVRTMARWDAVAAEPLVREALEEIARADETRPHPTTAGSRKGNPS